MKKFKNTFGVRGTKALIKAFAVEAELLGWKFDSTNKTKEDIGVNPPNLWFCASDNKTLNLKPGHYWCDLASGKGYELPKDWDIALKTASEIIEYTFIFKKRDWVHCTWDNGDEDIFQITDIRGDIYIQESHFRNGKYLNADRAGIKISPERQKMRLAISEEIEEVNKELLKHLIIKSELRVGDNVEVINERVSDGFYSNNHKMADYLRGWGGTRIIKDFKLINNKLYVHLQNSNHGYILASEVIRMHNNIEFLMGTSNTKVTVYKDGVVKAEWHSGTVEEVKQLIKIMECPRELAGWVASFPLVKIGCSKFKIDELQLIVSNYNKLNDKH